MSITRGERILFVVAAVAVIYRIVAEQWPVSLEVDE